jgi:hypothetical protein
MPSDDELGRIGCEAFYRHGDPSNDPHWENSTRICWDARQAHIAQAVAVRDAVYPAAYAAGAASSKCDHVTLAQAMEEDSDRLDKLVDIAHQTYTSSVGPRDEDRMHEALKAVLARVAVPKRGPMTPDEVQGLRVRIAAYAANRCGSPKGLCREDSPFNYVDSLLSGKAVNE